MYIAEISDPVKDNIDMIKNNKIEFIKIWYEVGKKNKGLYIQAFLYGSVGYFYPSASTTHPWSTVMQPYSLDTVVIKNTPKLKRYNNYLYYAGTTLYKDIPIASTFVCNALPFWIMIIVSSILIRERNYKMIIPILFIAVFWFSLLLGPVYCVRYSYPLLICIPLMISMPFCRYKSIE